MVTWFEAIPAVAAAAAMLLGPGLIATVWLPMRTLTRLSVAGMVSVCCAGVAAVIGGAVLWPFSWWQPFAVALIVMAVGLLTRLWIGGARTARAENDPLSARLIAVAAWVVAAALVIWSALGQVPGPDRISQTYDNMFHLSAISAILEGFSASPLTLRSLIETGSVGVAYYPSGWHTAVAGVVQLSGSSIATASMATWIVVSVALWLPGIAWFSVTVLRGFRPAAVVPVALLLGSAFTSFPLALLAWGTVYPTGLAHAILPASLAVLVAGIRWARTLRRTQRAGAVVIVFLGVASGIMALGLSHPRVLASWAVIAVPFIVWTAASAFRRALRRGGRSRRAAITALTATATLAIVSAGLGFAYLVVRLGLFDEPLTDRLNGPQARATQTIWEGVVEVMTGQFLTGNGYGVTWPSPLLAIALVIGIVVAVRHRPVRWLVVGFGLAATLFVLAAGSDDVIAKLATGLWYKDRFRLSANIPVVAIPLATLGVITVTTFAVRSAGAARAAIHRRRGLTATVLGAVVAASTVVIGVLSGTSASTARVFTLPDANASWEIVSQAQIDFYRDVVPAIVPEGQRVLGDPWDGSALIDLYAGRDAVFPHVNGQWDPDRLVLAYDLASIDDNPAVCDALGRLNVQYVVYNPHAFNGGDPAGNHFPAPHAAVEQGLFTEVATDGETVLYRIDQCG